MRRVDVLFEATGLRSNWLCQLLVRCIGIYTYTFVGIILKCVIMYDLYACVMCIMRVYDDGVQSVTVCVSVCNVRLFKIPIVTPTSLWLVGK